MINDPNPVVHLVSIMALGEVGVPALDILTECLENTDNISVAVAIVNALGSIPDDRSVQLLKSLSEDSSQDPLIQESAKSAASRLDQVIHFNSVKYGKNSEQ